MNKNCIRCQRDVENVNVAGDSYYTDAEFDSKGKNRRKQIEKKYNLNNSNNLISENQSSNQNLNKFNWKHPGLIEEGYF